MCRDTAAIARVVDLLQQHHTQGGGRVSFDLDDKERKIEFFVPVGKREFVVRFSDESPCEVAGQGPFLQQVGQAIRSGRRHIAFALPCLADVASRPRAWSGNGSMPITAR